MATTSAMWLRRSAIVLAQSSQALSNAAIALFLPLIRSDLDISFAGAGLLAAVPSLTYALMQLPAGYATDRMDPKLLFAGGVLLTNCLGIAFALGNSLAVLVIVQGLAGFSRAFMFIPGLQLITQQFSESRRASAMGLLFAGGLSAYVTVNLLGPALLAPFGWRGFMVTVSVGGLVALLGFWCMTPRSRRTQAEDAPSRPARVWRTSAWWLLALVQFVRMGIMNGFTFWLPTFLVVERGFPIAGAGLVVAGTYAVVAASNVVGGLVSDHWQVPVPIIGASLAALSVLMASIGFLSEPVLVVVGTALIAVFLQFYFGAMFVVPVRVFGPTVSGVSAGFGNFCANVGAFVASLSLGVLRDVTDSFTAGFLCMSGAALVALLAVTRLAMTLRHQEDAGEDMPTDGAYEVHQVTRGPAWSEDGSIT
ncbi:MAG: MFS transporter [Propionibacteriales bacterium]|nr:MFS transporter [Propionibacteriales bacterium]